MVTESAARTASARPPWPTAAKVTVAVLTLVLVVLAAGRSERASTPSAVPTPVPPLSTSTTSTSTSTSTMVPPAPTSTTPPASTTVATTAPPAPVAVPTTIAPAPPAPALAALRINDTLAAPGGYSRDLFPTWLDFDGNGCDARDDTLAAESLAPVTQNGCDVIGGQWLSIYDGAIVTDPSTLDVDHMVPLAEAWRSGAHMWDPQRRARFANDLTDPDHLIAVTAATNRSKGDRPPNEWRPPAEGSWCRYATAWINVKITWDLTATTPERDALGQMLDRCSAS